MFDGLNRRIVSMWFPRLASDRILRARVIDAPFALTFHEKNANRIYCLNARAERLGLHRGMPYADARAFCPDLISHVADIPAEQRFHHVLMRWATRYCPWVGYEGPDGLVLDITGAAHLYGGEAQMLADMRGRLARAGLSVKLGLADTRGAAWALARYGEGVAPPGGMEAAIADLPVAALRIDMQTDQALQRLGLRTIADLSNTARAPLTRRFGPSLLMRLDQALGHQPEQVSPSKSPTHYGVRLTLPDPIGLVDDVMAGTARLLDRLCHTLQSQQMGAQILHMALRRVDQETQTVELRLARPLHDPDRILPLFEKGIAAVDAGYGIDQMRLEAVQVMALPDQQLSSVQHGFQTQLDDLITRLGTRIGLDNIQRFLPADSHIPERSFIIAPAAYSQAGGVWNVVRPRPVFLFLPEPIAGRGSNPPNPFRWRRMRFSIGRATGPERIAPEWWMSDESWRSGVRDYWKVDTQEGRRLWLFYTPQSPGWFVHGEFA